MSDGIHIKYDARSICFAFVAKNVHLSNKMRTTHNSSHKSKFPVDSISQTLRYNDMTRKVVHLPEPGHINHLFKQLQVYDAKVGVCISLLPFWG
jgi:hypothetical protein